MKEQALKLANVFDEQAEFSFDMVLRSEGDSDVAQLLNRHHIQFAKEYQANAQLLRDMVAEITRLEEQLNKKLV